MRLLVGLVIFVLVVLLASESVSAKKSSREQSGKKRRGPAIEGANNDDRDRTTKSDRAQIHDKAHGRRKHRSTDEIDWERSGAEYSVGSNGGRWVENSRNSRSTGEREYARSLPKNLGREEETSSNSDAESTRKPKKLRKTESGAKSRQIREEDSFDDSEDEIRVCGQVAEDSADRADNIVEKKPKREPAKREKNYENRSRASSSESNNEDESEVPKNERHRRQVAKLEESVCEKSSEGAKKGSKQRGLEDTNETDARCVKKLRKISRSSMKRKNDDSEKPSKEIICTDSESEEILTKFASEHQIDGRNVKDSLEMDEAPLKNEEEEDEDDDETR